MPKQQFAHRESRIREVQWNIINFIQRKNRFFTLTYYTTMNSNTMQGNYKQFFLRNFSANHGNVDSLVEHNDFRESSIFIENSTAKQQVNPLLSHFRENRFSSFCRIGNQHGDANFGISLKIGRLLFLKTNKIFLQNRKCSIQRCNHTKETKNEVPTNKQCFSPYNRDCSVRKD